MDPQEINIEKLWKKKFDVEKLIELNVKSPYTAHAFIPFGIERNKIVNRIIKDDA